MTNKERAELIQNAIRDYRAARESGDAQKIRFAVNYMENTFSPSVSGPYPERKNSGR